MALPVYFLVILMPLAGNHHNITRPRTCYSGGYGRGTVRILFCIGCGGQPVKNLCPDMCRGLVARVVIRYQQLVSTRLCRSGHQSPLAGIPPATAAKYAVQAPT